MIFWVLRAAALKHLTWRRTRVSLVREQHPVAAPLLPDFHHTNAYGHDLARFVYGLRRKIVTHNGIVADNGDASLGEFNGPRHQTPGQEVIYKLLSVFDLSGRMAVAQLRREQRLELRPIS
jgi:hypothetical protein